MKIENERFNKITSNPSKVFPSLSRVIISKEKVLKVVREPSKPVFKAKLKFTGAVGSSIFDKRKKISDPNTLTKSVPVQKTLN